MKNPLHSPATLIFPAVNHLALDYWRAAKARGERTVAAASVRGDEMSMDSGEVHRLPMVYEADFQAAFLALAADNSINRIFCPVASVHGFMRRFIAMQGLDIEVIGASPIRQQVEEHYRLMARANRLLPLVASCADGAAAFSPVDVAGVLRQASLIYGESNDEKLAAMMGAIASAPRADVVEIGSLMGRTAFVLLYLARRFGIGPLLTVDPWMSGHAVQRDAPESLQGLVDEWDYEALSEGFFVNLAPFRAADHAHLRMPSEQAFAVYAKGGPVPAPDSATVHYSGGIAVLHVDGNHDYDAVRNDCDLWLDRLVPGAWLILDDYIWAHGDGPRRVGDEILGGYRKRIERAFVCGTALFVKLYG